MKSSTSNFKIVKMVNEFREDLRNELREKIQDVKAHFNREILKRTQTEILKMGFNESN